MAERFDFRDDDLLVRRIPSRKRNKSGRPTRGAFQGADGQTSVYLKRLLRGGPVPSRQANEDLAEFPAKWIFDLSLTKTPLQLKKGSGAHFSILGELHIEFRDFLRDNAKIIPSALLDRD